MRRAIMSSAWLLPDDPLVQGVGQLQHGLDLVLDHAADRDAGPVADDGGDRLGVDGRQDQRRLALQLGQLGLRQARSCPSASAVGSAPRPARSVAAISPSPAPSPLFQRRLDAPPAGRVSASSFVLRRRPRARAVAVSMPARLLAPDDLQLDLQRLDPAAAVLHLGRHGVLADGDARAGRVEQAHRLVGQLARRECSGATA